MKYEQYLVIQCCYCRGCFELQTCCVLENRFCEIGHAILKLQHIALSILKRVSVYFVKFSHLFNGQNKLHIIKHATFLILKKIDILTSLSY